MGRVSVEERAWARMPRLARRCGWSKELALWKLLHLWKVSQESLKVSVTVDDIIDWMQVGETEINGVVEAMIECEYLTDNQDGTYRVRGNEEHVAKLQHLREASALGVRARLKKTDSRKSDQPSAEPYGQPTGSADGQPNDDRDGDRVGNHTNSTAQHSTEGFEEGGLGETPPAPPDAAVEIERCKELWRQTLRYFRGGRTLLQPEEERIARATRRWGPKAVSFALIGARHEPKGKDGFDPSKNVSLSRVLPGVMSGDRSKAEEDQKKFERFLHLGVQAEHQRQAGEA